MKRLYYYTYLESLYIFQMLNNPFMQAALLEAEKAFHMQEVPVGAVVVYQNKIIAAAHNLCIVSCDPTAHAEMLAIRSAVQQLKAERLSECEMYVTLEPCPMCAHAISLARIKRLYFGSDDLKGGGVINGPRLYTQDTCLHRPEVLPGVMSRQATQLLQDFFKQLRKK